jgi:hypothetical protein
MTEGWIPLEEKCARPRYEEDFGRPCFFELTRRVDYVLKEILKYRECSVLENGKARNANINAKACSIGMGGYVGNSNRKIMSNMGSKMD